MLFALCTNFGHAKLRDRPQTSSQLLNFSRQQENLSRGMLPGEVKPFLKEQQEQFLRIASLPATIPERVSLSTSVAAAQA